MLELRTIPPGLPPRIRSGIFFFFFIGRSPTISPFSRSLSTETLGYRAPGVGMGEERRYYVIMLFFPRWMRVGSVSRLPDSASSSLRCIIGMIFIGLCPWWGTDHRHTLVNI